MKKIISLFIILGIVTVGLSGCGKGKTAEEAAEMLVNRLIYDKENEDFSKTFENGNQLEKAIKEENSNFTKEFMEGFNSSSGVSFSAEKGADLAKNWKMKVEKETKFKVVDVEEQKNKYVVTYEIYGLDFVASYKVMMDALMEKVIADPTTASDGDKLNQLVQDETVKAISEIKVSGKAVKSKLNLEKKGSKYSVSNDEADNMQAINSAFYLGQSDSNVLNEQMTKIGQESQEKITSQLMGQ